MSSTKTVYHGNMCVDCECFTMRADAKRCRECYRAHIREVGSWNRGKKGVQEAWNKGKKTGLRPWNKGKEALPHVKEAVRRANKGNTYRKGIVLSEETKQKISRGRKGKGVGESNGRWISDRTKLKKGREHAYDYAYKDWMKAVKNRDGWQCKIANDSCSGRLEAHHILPWSAYPDLRYEVNNGITLCAFHHPRKRKDEKKYAPLFQILVASKSRYLE